MKKFTGRYTTNTAKALKGSERILCQVSEDGTIYICNGFLLCTMNAPEYAATVQPLTCCEPGAWTFDKDGKHEDEAHKLDLVKLFADTVRDTAEQIAARRAAVTITVDEGSEDSAENIFSAMLAADTFHTFAEWKRMGYSVKKGQHAALTCQLWKYTDKPGKAAREAAEAAGQDTPETDPHFYMTKAHLFHALQVEKSKR